ncbi:disease resistance protein RPV1-like isoform X2 [Vicia villosa]|uniref:disease resistance protein RPV1-like isoform X2 n=1 Tax=Vicia villosa TaxID=3911 RepID=UPI00273C5A81|nr:disease resistance protein RPV1-like isoform X2 [Vicia villosa]
MGGIGKTTIAKVLFAKLFAQYDHVCFAKGKESSPSKLLSELLKEEISPSNIVGSTFHMRRLRSRKVFIVLDNVDNLDQFEYLCRGYNDLSNDSRLIITTRDRQLLSERVDWIYKVKQWEDPESLKLFCLEAFQQNLPPRNYEDLSQSAVTYAGGIPLALKLLALHLRSRDIEFWESTFRKLDKHPKEDIHKVLKLSYDGLDALEKKIFLDIAFFFKGENKDRVARILDACGFEASSGIVVLKDKALISISNNLTIQMHDLLQKMGSDIVCNDSGINPAIHTRTRLSGAEARAVIEENKGNSSIEGITLDLSQINDMLLSADTFTKMKALRILKFYAPSNQRCTNTYLNLPTFLEPFSNQLRYFEWNGYPFESLPQPFCAKFLVEIHMPHSNLKQLWQGTEELGMLEGIDLSECKHFERLPDLSKASSLKWVNLSGCESLVDLHPSVLCAESLVTLILDGCTKVRSVRGEKHFIFLEKISVDGCTSLEEFAVSSDLIENLDLSSTGIQTLDLSIGRLQKLKRLNLQSLRLKHLPKELSSVRSIKELKISGSRLMVEKQQLHELFDGLQSIKILHMKDFRNLSELPNNLSVLSKLKELNLDGSNVKRLPESINQLQELETLSLVNCRKLRCLPKLPPLIKQLYAVNCTSLVSVSNLKTLASKMMGNAKHISFKNSLSLDGHSLELITESLNLTMMSAVFQNVSVRRHENVHSYNYTSVDACLRGTSIPKQFKCRTATDSSITIQQLPDRSILLGFIYSVILSPVGGNRMNKDGARIQCQCNLGQTGIKTTWLNTDVTDLKSDHIYVWYDPFHCDSILKFYEPKICYEFCVTNDTGEVDGSIGIIIKECGVRLVSVEELESVLPELDLDLDKKMELKRGVKKEIEASDYKTDQIPNQQLYTSQKSSSDGKHVKLDLVEEDSESENHIFNGEKSMESTSEETKSMIICNGAPLILVPKLFPQLKSRGNEASAGLHVQLVESVAGENNFEETKQKGQVIVPENESDEDPFNELLNILMGSPNSSPKETCSTSDTAVSTALNNLEWLLKNSLKSILYDAELQQQLHVSLECIKHASREKVSPNVVKLVQKMIPSIKNLFKDFVMIEKVVEDHINALQQKENKTRQVIDGMKQKKSKEKEKIQFEDEVKRLEEDGRRVDEKIQILVEQKKSIELEKTKLKERMKRCEGEKKELDDEAKNMITEAKELMSRIKNSEPLYAAALSQQQKLNDNWEGFRTDFADNYGSSREE